VIALKIRTGDSFDIFALEEDGECKVLEFLNLISKSRRQCFLKLVNGFDRTADTGLMQNEERFKPLHAGIFEFRVPGEVRILCFLDGSGIVVLTNGFTTDKMEAGTRHASELRDRYLDAKRNGYLTYREDNL